MKKFISKEWHPPYPASLGCSCDACEEGRRKERELKKGKKS